MSTGRPPPGSVPTLTEVLSWPSETTVAPPDPQRDEGKAPPQAAPHDLVPESSWRPQASLARQSEASPAAVDRASEAEIGEQLLVQIQQQLELAIDVRLREALAPMLARTADSLVRDARREMATLLRDIVARAVDAELERRRKR